MSAIIPQHSVSVREDRKMANSFVRGNKLWIDYYVDGIRHRKATGLDDTKENRTLVKKTIIPKLMTMIATGEIHQNKPKTFGYYFDIFLKLKDGNKAYFKKIHQWNKVNERFKDVDINRITRLDVKRYILDLPIKSVSKGAYKHALKEIFELALDDETIKNNPAVNIKLPADGTNKVDYFTKEEVNLLISNATSIMRPYLMLAFNTGMRPEEILGLQFGDIGDGWIDIKRVRTCGRIDHPKTRNSIRRIPCPRFVIDELNAMQKDHIFLFGNNNDVSRLHSRWWNLLKRCGMERRKLYSTRHTFATIMLQDSIVSINELAGLLGHSTPKITLSYYASVIDSKTIDLGKNFDLFDTIRSQSKIRKL